MASKYRQNVLFALHEKSMTPSMISKKTKIYPSHVSMTLNELTGKKLIECLTPELRKGKLYVLTDIGTTILKKLS